jgi:hypothetical protein
MGLPWETPDGTGLIRRWWESCKLGMFSPTQYYQQLRHTDDLGRAIGFAAVCAAVSTILGTLVSFVFMALLASSTGVGGMGGAFPIGVGLLMQGMQILVAVPLQIVGLFVGGAILHVGVIIFIRTRGSYVNTVVVLAYALCPAVWALIPFLGGYVTGIWALLVAFRGIVVIHRTTWARALVACMTPSLLLLTALVLIAGSLAFITAA